MSRHLASSIPSRFAFQQPQADLSSLASQTRMAFHYFSLAMIEVLRSPSSTPATQSLYLTQVEANQVRAESPSLDARS
jgi:hypothetical protein